MALASVPVMSLLSSRGIVNTVAISTLAGVGVADGEKDGLLEGLLVGDAVGSWLGKLLGDAE